MDVGRLAPIQRHEEEAVGTDSEKCRHGIAILSHRVEVSTAGASKPLVRLTHLSERSKSRIAFMPADIDRRYAREHLTDHADLLANIARWAAGDSIPLTVDGPGFLDCHLYQQPGHMILHIVNLTSAGTWRAPVEELTPGGAAHGKDEVGHGCCGWERSLARLGHNETGSLRPGLCQF